MEDTFSVANAKCMSCPAICGMKEEYNAAGEGLNQLINTGMMDQLPEEALAIVQGAFGEEGARVMENIPEDVKNPLFTALRQALDGPIGQMIDRRSEIHAEAEARSEGCTGTISMRVKHGSGRVITATVCASSTAPSGSSTEQARIHRS